MTYGAVAWGAGPYASPEGAAASASTAPTLGVEIAFVSSPTDEEPVWIDVTPDVRSLSYTRGKQRELDRYQAGTAQVVLANADRKYDPSYKTANLLDQRNIGFEYGMGGWHQADTGLVGTLSVVSSQAQSGSNSLQVVLNAADDDIEISMVNGEPFDQLTIDTHTPKTRPNTTYTFSCYTKKDAGTTDQIEATLFIDAFDINGVYVGTFEEMATVADLGTSWTQLSVTFTTTNTTQYIWPFVRWFNVPGLGGTFYLDSVMLAEGEDDTFVDPATRSLYAPNIRPQRRIRISETFSGVTYYLFEGFIDSWDQVRNGPNDATAVLICTDGFKNLSRAGLASSAYAQEVVFDNPAHWWKFDDTTGSVTAKDYGYGLADAVSSGSPTFGEASLIAREGGTCVSVDSSSDFFSVTPSRVAILDGTPFTIEAVVKLAANPSASFTLLSNFITGTGSSLSLKVLTSGFVEFFSGATATSSTDIADNAVHHLCAVRDGSSVYLYVDGTLVASAGGASGVPGTGYAFFLLRDMASTTGYVQSLAIYEKSLSASRVAAHAAAISTPWNNDTPAGRLDRVLDHINWPESRREIDTGNSTLQSADIANTSALEHIQKVGESEFGKVFISKLGSVRLIEREAQWNRTPLFTFTDDDHYQASDPEYTDALIRNDVTVSRFEGVAQNTRDLASIREYQVSSYTLDGLYHDDDDLSRYASQYIVAVYRDPLLRISSLTIKPQGNASVLFPALYGLELGDWLTIQETPQDVSPAITQTCVVEGISYERGPKDWMVTLNLSPADTAAYWLAGVDGYSNAGVSTRPGF